MSVNLGPIHYWLYNKIQLQQAIVDEIYCLGEKYGLALEEDCNRLYGTFENRPLEEMIDHGNIHAWLQERVNQVEYKYAWSVTQLLNKDPGAIDNIKTIVAVNATNLAVTLKEFPFDAAAVYRAIEDNLLDGMPCDHTNKVQKQTHYEVIWTRELCVHSRYWEEVGGNIKIHYELRDVWIEAFVMELGFLFVKPDADTYSIKSFGADFG